MSHKVYYLDDEPDLLDMFKDFFSTADCEIKTFSNPDEFINCVQQVPPDLVFLDYRLPGCTGIDIAKKLNAHVPQVLITGDMDVNTDHPFVSIISKPYEPSAIEAIMKTHLKSDSKDH